MTPLLLRRRPTTVEAVQLTDENLSAVASWCGGVESEGKGVWIYMDSAIPGFASINQWVIRGPAGFYPATDEALWAGYEAVL